MRQWSIGLLVALAMCWVQTAQASDRLDAARTRVCFAPSVGGLKCWGGGASTPYSLPNASELYSQVAAGGLTLEHVCLRTASGAARCFGDNAIGQLGDGTTINRGTPVSVLGMDQSVTQVDAGRDSTCALRSGEVWCWGGAAPLEQGFGYSNVPVRKLGFSASVVELAVGEYFACVRLSNGSVECWGQNLNGQLGNGSFTSSNAPVAVIGLPAAATKVSAGPISVCAIVSGGALYCWGGNGFGNLGDGTAQSSSIATPVVGLTSGVIDVQPSGTHTCAIVAGGAIKCWGLDVNGELGDGPAYGPQPTGSYLPREVLGISGARMLTVADSLGFSCAGFDNDRVKCWGRNDVGQLGDGTNIDRDAPVDVLPLSPLHFRVFHSSFEVAP